MCVPFFVSLRNFNRFRRVYLPFAPGRNSPKSAEISQTQRKVYTRLQVSLVQFISRYSPEIRLLILYHRNPIPTLIWHPIAWASCDQPRPQATVEKRSGDAGGKDFFLSQPANDAATGVRCTAARDWRKGLARPRTHTTCAPAVAGWERKKGLFCSLLIFQHLRSAQRACRALPWCTVLDEAASPHWQSCQK